MNTIIVGIVQIIKESVRMIHEQDYSSAAEKIGYLFSDLLNLEEFAQEAGDKNSYIMSLFDNMRLALEREDMILLADYLEEGLLPWAQSIIEHCDSIVEGKYVIEPTSSGLWTMRDTYSGLYIHSNINPYCAEQEWIAAVTNIQDEMYIIWGLGLGYHVLALSKKILNSKKIVVFEEDNRVISICRKYGASSIFEKDNVEVVYDKFGYHFAECIGRERIGILIHYSSVKKIEDLALKGKMEKLFLSWNTTALKKNELFLNFERNLLAEADSIDILASRVSGKKVLYAGGGPSLSDSVSFIKRNREEIVVFSATTVLKKLLLEGITPDYAIVLDPQERTFGHMDDIPKNNVPLIFASTAYWKFATLENRKKYIVFQKQYKPAELEAQKRGVNTYATGGSVTTLALDILIKLGADTIYFAGVDMGFPCGKTHVEGTLDAKKISSDHLISVPTVNGETIMTDEKMIYYLRWIENEISDNPGHKYVNLSKCGAKIDGMLSE